VFRGALSLSPLSSLSPVRPSLSSLFSLLSCLCARSLARPLVPWQQSRLTCALSGRIAIFPPSFPPSRLHVKPTLGVPAQHRDVRRTLAGRSGAVGRCHSLHCRQQGQRKARIRTAAAGVGELREGNGREAEVAEGGKWGRGSTRIRGSIRS
jgi:hypothetical protein